MVADEFECVLAGPPANAFAVAGKVELFNLGMLGVGKGAEPDAAGAELLLDTYLARHPADADGHNIEAVFYDYDAK